MIEAAEEKKIKDPTKTPNDDELRKISEKPLHTAVHKELKEVMEILTRGEALEEKRIAAEKAQTAATHAEDVERAKEEGRKEAAVQADENLRLLLSFLRNVSVRRAMAANRQIRDSADDAFEAALGMVYGVNEDGFTAFAACQMLFNGVDEPVKDSSATCMYFGVSSSVYNSDSPKAMN